MSAAALLRGARETVTLSNGAEVVVRAVNALEAGVPIAVGPDGRMSAQADPEQIRAMIKTMVCKGVVRPRIVDVPPEQVQDPDNEVSVYELPDKLLFELLGHIQRLSGHADAASFRDAAAPHGTGD